MEVGGAACPGSLPINLIDATYRLNCQNVCSSASLIIKTTSFLNTAWSHVVTFITTASALDAVLSIQLFFPRTVCLLLSMLAGTYARWAPHVFASVSFPARLAPSAVYEVERISDPLLFRHPCLFLDGYTPFIFCWGSIKRWSWTGAISLLTVLILA